MFQWILSLKLQHDDVKMYEVSPEEVVKLCELVLLLRDEEMTFTLTDIFLSDVSSFGTRVAV